MNDWPYRKTGGGRWLEVREVREDDPSGTEGCVVTTGERGFVLDSADFPEVARAMWAAYGQAPPVMLGRPDLDALRDRDGWIEFRGLRVRRAPGGGVSFAVGGNAETLPEAMARQCAAVTVALADERKDAADLAAVIRSEFPASGDGDEERMYQLIAGRAAAKILADGYQRGGGR
jgi:hypothetical protein